MGWTAGADVTTGDLITAAAWNSYLGASGSLEYLKTKADAIVACSQSQPVRAKDTVYQNTSDKIMIVVTYTNLNPAEEARLLCDASTPPTDIVAEFDNDLASGTLAASLCAIIPPDYYYELEETAGAWNILEWTEYLFY